MIHVYLCGTKVEYRRVRHRPGILDLESRELRPDGSPYDEHWYAVSDREMLELELTGSDIVSRLAAE